jgi:putative ABC transport system permease protein
MKSNLIVQFMGEAFLTSLLSLVIAIIILYIFLPTFNSITQKQIQLSISQPLFWRLTGSVFIVTGLLAGIYPAFFLSSLKPIRIFKGILKFKRGQILFRKSLVVSQFFMSVVLIIGTLVVFFQMRYIRNKDLGYDKANLVIMPLEKDLYPNLEAFKHEVLASTSILSMTLASQAPSEIESSTGGVFWPGKPENEAILFPFELADYNYINTLNIALKEGRNFSPSFPSDSLAVIVNEEAVRRMKMKDPIGKTIRFWQKPHTIIGVVKDFHLTSMHSSIDPFILHLAPQLASTSYMLIKARQGQAKQALEVLEKASKKYNPAYPFEYEFYDQVFEKQYKSELIVETLAKYFAGLAILIACLGLLGLTIFSIQQRIREISIRKVLGASATSILQLLSKDFLGLIGISFVLAAPLANYFMNSWLEDFAYHIKLTWWMFCFAGMLVIVIALLTIGFQAIKAALANPVNSLRKE